jgi:hypothetical protein
VSLDPGGIPRKMLTIHHRLVAAGLDHAFGGALALAWCTQQARGTIDVDVNIFVSPDRVAEVLAALPSGVTVSDEDMARLERDGQTRLRWASTPVDVFLSTTDFHEAAATRIRSEPFAGESLPFLACEDLAVFKAFFNRTRDWADLEAMHDAGSLDVAAVAGVLARYLGADDDRIARLLALA